jgi:hypothetical protein
VVYVERGRDARGKHTVSTGTLGTKIKERPFPANLTLEPSYPLERERIDMLGRYWFVARVARDSDPPKLRGIAKPLS